MKTKIFLRKRVLSVLLCLAMLLCLLPNLVIPKASAATGYDRGYTGGRAGWGKIYANGIDVSEHQGTGFNFQNLKNNGYSYVILRCGFSSRKDYRFEEYYTNAKAAGLNVGVYFYSYATTAAAAAQEADICLSYIQGKKFEYPIYFDYEDGSANSRNGTLAKSMCLAFLDKIANAGYLAGLYGYAGWLDEDYGGWVPTASICQRYECWLANYYDYSGYATYGTKYSTRYGMYQYQSDKYVGGVGPLDANICYKDYPSIVKQYGFNGYSAASTETYATINDGTYTISAHDNSGYCIDISGQSMENGVQSHLWTKNYGDSQKFVIKRDGDKTYSIRNLKTGKYLEILYGGANGEYKVTQCSYTNSDAQRWYIIANSDGSYTLKNKATGKYMDLANGTIANGTHIQTWTSNGSAAQKWWLTPVDTLIDGVYTVRSSKDSNWGWDIAGYSMDSGANLQMWDSQHKFVFQHDDSGYYTIRVLGSGHYIDVPYCNSDNGVSLWQCTQIADSNAQKWLVIPNEDGTYSFVSKGTGKYIDMKGGLTPANGTDVIQYTGNGTSAQKWVLNLQSEVPEDTYLISYAASPDYRLEIQNRSKDDGGNLILYTSHGATSQQFTFAARSDGYYTITNVNSGKQLDVAGGGKANGTNIQQYGDTGVNQNWSVIPNTDGSYSFVSRANNRYLDLTNAKVANDTNIQCCVNNGSGAQRWKLYDASYLDPVVYNSRYYRDNNSDLKNMNDTQLQVHWLDHGIKEGRSASATFNSKWYLSNNNDLSNAFGADGYAKALWHFVGWGIKEGRASSALFNLNSYKSRFDDLRNAYGNDNYSYYKHYSLYGYYEGRNAAANDLSGWNNNSFYSNNRKVFGWLVSGGNIYHTDSNGNKQTGWQQLDNKWYYFNSDGTMKTGWLQLDGKCYFLNSDGHMATGWTKVDGKQYYLKSDGVMVTGSQTINGINYTFDSNGALQN